MLRGCPRLQALRKQAKCCGLPVPVGMVALGRVSRARTETSTPKSCPPPTLARGPEVGGAPRPAGVRDGHLCLPGLGALEQLVTGPELLGRGLRAQGPLMLLHAVPYLTPAPGWRLEPPAELPGFAPASPAPQPETLSLCVRVCSALVSSWGRWSRVTAGEGGTENGPCLVTGDSRHAPPPVPAGRAPPHPCSPERLPGAPQPPPRAQRNSRPRMLPLLTPPPRRPEARVPWSPTPTCACLFTAGLSRELIVTNLGL